MISGSSRLARPARADGHETSTTSDGKTPDNQQERERELEEAAGTQERDPGASQNEVAEHAGEGTVVPIHAEEIEWMSELPMKNATVNGRNSTPTSTAILL